MENIAESALPPSALSRPSTRTWLFACFFVHGGEYNRCFFSPFLNWSDIPKPGREGWKTALSHVVGVCLSVPQPVRCLSRPCLARGEPTTVRHKIFCIDDRATQHRTNIYMDSCPLLDRSDLAPHLDPFHGSTAVAQSRNDRWRSQDKTDTFVRQRPCERFCPASNRARGPRPTLLLAETTRRWPD